MERLDAGQAREPGLASEALRALADLARDEEPQPARRTAFRAVPKPRPDRDAATPRPEASRDVTPPVPAPAPRASRLSRPVLLAAVAVPVLLGIWLLVMLVVS